MAGSLYQSTIREIIICSAAQSGKTESILNCLRYAIAEDPGPALWIMPAESLARSFGDSRPENYLENLFLGHSQTLWGIRCRR
jgi:phage terminase large subunit GpA-like protein